MRNIPQVLNECQKTFASHKKGVSTLCKLRQKDSKAFDAELLNLINRILVVFKRDPAVERLIQFLIAFCVTSAESSKNDFALILVNYLLPLTQVQDKAVRFRSVQLIAGIINSLSDEYELEYEKAISPCFSSIAQLN
jgi:condensin complex subunit 3